MSLIKERKPRVTVLQVPLGGDTESLDDDSDVEVVSEGVHPNATTFSYKIRYHEIDIPVSKEIKSVRYAK